MSISIFNFNSNFPFQLSILILFYFLFLAISYSLLGERVDRRPFCRVRVWRRDKISIKSLHSTFSITKSYCFWRRIPRSQHRLNWLVRNWSHSKDCARLVPWKCRQKFNLTFNWRDTWIENFTSGIFGSGRLSNKIFF